MATKRLWPQKNKADKKTEAAKMRKGANKKVKRRQKSKAKNSKVATIFGFSYKNSSLNRRYNNISLK